MKIIKPGNLDSTILRFSCSSCGCVFDADVSEYSPILFVGGSNYYECRCPTCDNKCSLEVKEGESNG